MFTGFGAALTDIREAIRLRSVWLALATEDIGDQHRRTTLGPLWLLVNYLAFAGTFVVIFGGAHHGTNFVAYTSLGLIVWFYISDVVTQSTNLFAREEAFIKGTTLPLTTYVLRLTMQAVIRTGYAMIGCIGLLFFAGVSPSPIWIWSLVGAAIVILVTPPVVLISAVAGAFFPDLQFIVQNLMRLGMFLTPIFWGTNAETGVRGAVYSWNPFTHLISIVRTPITSDTVPVFSFVFCFVVLVIAWLAGLAILGRFRKQIVFVI